MKAIIEHEKVTNLKHKKAGLVLTIIGGAWIMRSLVFMMLDVYKISLIVSIIISIIAGILALKGMKLGRIISLIGAIINPILIICVVYNPSLWIYDFWYGLLNTLLLLFLTIYGFGLFGIAFVLFVIGGILSFKKY